MPIVARLCAVGIVLLASMPATATTERVTLYMHSLTPSGSADQALAFAGRAEGRTFMDATPPSAEVPKVSELPSGNVANPNLYGNVLAAYWPGRIRGTLSNVTVTLWAQSARSTAEALDVSLFADGSDTPLATAQTTTSEPAPTEVTASFPGLEVAVGSELLVQVLPASNRQLAVYYDATITPSNVSFDLAPLPAVPPGAGIFDDLGRVTYGSGGGCEAGDALCERALALRDDSQVVIAIIDTGVNPYHVAFERDGLDVHPSEYITSYPSDAAGIVFSRDASYPVARANDDDEVWQQVEPNTLYWFPGTNIIGAISVVPDDPSHAGAWDPRPIIDDHGHGTGSSTVAAGGGARADNGAPFGSNPDALLVIVEGFGTDAVEWVRNQPWIDFMSGSYGDQYAIPVGGVTGGREHEHTRPFVLDDGRTACFSAGNGVTKTGLGPDRWSSIRPTSGPSWVITVGAVSPHNQQDYWWHSVPVDVSSYGNFWPAADAFSADGEQVFSGTSSATPITCGVFSRALQAARRALGDTEEGLHDGNPAVGAPVIGSPFLSDGVLSRLELQDAVLKTAEPAAFDAGSAAQDPGVMPTTEAYYTYQGYGITNVASGMRAIDVLLGAAPLPDRADVDAWIATVDAVRDVFYPPAG